jgi:hypothetical protein
MHVSSTPDLHTTACRSSTANLTWRADWRQAVDWYTTFAALAGADVNSTGPLPPDGTNIWPDLVANRTDPARHMLIQYTSVSATGTKLAQPIGVVRKGDWKLITGYPGWGRPGWDGHYPLPAPDQPIEGWEEAHTHVPFGNRGVGNCSGPDGITGAGARPSPPHKMAVAVHLLDLRVRVERMGPGKYENVGKSQSVLIMNDPIIFIRTRRILPDVVLTCSRC